MRVKTNNIYLDYAASTPVHPAVLKAMMPYFLENFGNAGSLHRFGQEAIKAIDESREVIAKAIGRPAAAGFREIIFTGSATEANNLALRGALKDKPKDSRIIILAIEHESVLETARDLERDGFDVIYLPVSREGLVDLNKLKSALNDKTILVSVMYVNNEIGTVQPIAEISKIISEFKERKFISQKDGVSLAQPLARPLDSRPRSSDFVGDRARSGSETLFLEKNLLSSYPLFHIDAVQAFQFFDCDVKKLGVDLMTLSAHKIYGPKGIGALYLREKIKKEIKPIITGGGQEFGLRSGTENTPLIVGFGKAVELVSARRKQNCLKTEKLKKYFLARLEKIFPALAVNGPIDDKSAPHILNVYLPGTLADEMLIKLDKVGVAVSAGSACSARATKLSHVLTAIGLEQERIMSSLRFSFGRETKIADLKKVLEILIPLEISRF
ncbi:MAG: cysteine desulfurase family protein [Patescibacteria group bacterium]